jgi:hypothetical protein
MPHRIRPRAPANTPIERIFEKVVGRKMNLRERISLHLHRKPKISPAVSSVRHRRAA